MRLDRIAVLSLSTSVALHASFATGFDRLIFSRPEGRRLPALTRMKLVYYQTAEATAPSGRAPGAVIRTYVPSKGAIWTKKEPQRTALVPSLSKPAPVAAKPVPRADPAQANPVEKPPDFSVVENLDLTDERVSAYFYDYYAILSRAIRDHAAYPRAALERGLTGEVQISFTLRRDGEVRSVKLKKSSGERELDSGALEAVRGASPMPPIPSTLDVEELRLKVPIRFDRGS